MRGIRWSTAVRVALLAIPLTLLYAAFWPTVVAPVAWEPPPAPPLEGAYAANDALHGVERIAAVGRFGPECIDFDAQGRFYTGYLDGTIMRFEADGSGGMEIADTDGRPLCVRPLRDGSLIVSDAARGVLRVGADGTVEVLAEEHAGVPFRLTDDVAVSADERSAYFTDASDKFAFYEHVRDILEHGANGRLLRIDLVTRETTLLIDDLHFANGLAFGPGEQYLLVGETGSYRILRYWLAGARAGTHEVFIDNLPGFPDNIAWNGRDRFWVAMANPRNPLLDGLGPHPFLRQVVDRMPTLIRPGPVRYAFALALDENGRVVANLQDGSEDCYAPVTTAREHDGWLYLGSLGEKSVARLRLTP